MRGTQCIEYAQGVKMLLPLVAITKHIPAKYLRLGTCKNCVTTV